jgi:hypothetical protein
MRRVGPVSPSGSPRFQPSTRSSAAKRIPDTPSNYLEIADCSGRRDGCIHRRARALRIAGWDLREPELPRSGCCLTPT